MSEKDLPWYFHQVRQRTAIRLCIQDAEWKGNAELEKEIEAHEKVHEALKKFFDAYQSWVEEQNEDTIKARDETRKQFLVELELASSQPDERKP